ncbi:MAG: hypothetical protein AAF928_16045 [Myxococcota bacterium]
MTDGSAQPTAEMAAATDGVRRGALVVTWLLLVSWAVFVAPAGDGGDADRVVAWFQLDGPPLVVALFNLMGVWPLLYAAVLLRDPPQRVPAWPFVVLSFATGAFALLPYLALRRWGVASRPDLGKVRAAMTGRGLAGGLLLAATALMAAGIGWGDLRSLAELAPRSGLVTTMTADFVVLTVAWWLVLHDDVRRHGGPAWAAWLGVVPVVGAPVWLLFRQVRNAPTDGAT